MLRYIFPPNFVVFSNLFYHDFTKKDLEKKMKFARATFLVAGLYGLLVMTPFLFLEQWISQDTPPAITHPEYYYGFVLVTLAWQVAFIVISRDPARYRGLMLPAAIFEKFAYSGALLTLLAQGRVAASVALFGLIDVVLGVLFVVAYVRTRSTQIF
jgi:hypothetical protein